MIGNVEELLLLLIRVCWVHSSGGGHDWVGIESVDVKKGSTLIALAVDNTNQIVDKSMIEVCSSQ